MTRILCVAFNGTEMSLEARLLVFKWYESTGVAQELRHGAIWVLSCRVLVKEFNLQMLDKI